MENKVGSAFVHFTNLQSWTTISSEQRSRISALHPLIGEMFMLKKVLVSLLTMSCLSAASGLVLADGHTRSKWTDISNDKNYFDKNCDYKVWVMQDGEWSETWYLEAFDAENAFYTISRQSTTWSDTDAFYALNYQDKSKFLIGENFIDVVTFSLCLNK